MGFRRRRSYESPKIDLTPMVDVVFLLVIFFMLSTTFVERPGLKIDLPVAESHYHKENNTEVRAYFAANGDIFLQRQKMTWHEFQLKLDSYNLESKKNMTFILMADENSRHGGVVRLMDAAKHAGIGHLVIATAEDSSDRD